MAGDIIDLLPLSTCLAFLKFKLETVTSVLASIQKGYAVFSAELNDVYYQILICLESRPILCFIMNDKIHEFRTLCFGLSSQGCLL